MQLYPCPYCKDTFTLQKLKTFTFTYALLFYVMLGLLLPSVLLAQDGTITGKVMSADIQIPLVRASVFLSNATFGTSTADDGTFTLSGVKPGQYELVVSYVGYDSYHKTILVGSTPIKLDIEMHLKSTSLNEVSIVVHKFSKENYAMFLKYFLGVTPNAKQCKILNPTIIDLSYNSVDKILKGHSDDFIIIENRALGYRLKYLLDKFEYDGINEIISIGGQPLYEDLKGNKRQLDLWKKKREEAYYGSSMHFYRAMLHNDLEQQGFIMYHLIRKPNPNRPAQIVIVKKLDHFEAQGGPRDSVFYWQNLYAMKKYNEDLIRTPLSVFDVLRVTDDKGIYGITFPDNLYVVYTKRHDPLSDVNLYRPLDMENYMVSIITLYKPAAFFDLNGVVISGESTLYEGAWARNKIPELLPVDYAPEDKVKVQ